MHNVGVDEFSMDVKDSTQRFGIQYYCCCTRLAKIYRTESSDHTQRTPEDPWFTNVGGEGDKTDRVVLWNDR